MSRALSTSYSSSMYNQEMKPLDYLYGPWETIDQMLEELDVRVDEIEPGLTVAVVEGDKVVEYWNPIPNLGFFKKTPGGTLCDILENYDEAMEYAKDRRNVLNLVYVKNEQSKPAQYEESVVEDDAHDCLKPVKCETEHNKYTLVEGTGTSFGSGLYYVKALGELEYVASDIWYGTFPEDTDQLMTSDKVEPVFVDGAARVSDVYRMFKKEQLHTRKRLGHLEHHVHWMVDDLDDKRPEDNYEHTYVNKVINDGYGKVEISHNDLDTDRVLMDGHDEVGTEHGDETFIDVRGTNIGSWKNGSVIHKGDSLETVLKGMFIKELVPTEMELPTVELTTEPEGMLAGEEDDEIIYEVGSVFTPTLGYVFHDGKLQTYEGCEGTDDGEMVDAGCKEDAVRYYVSRPNSEDFEQVLNNKLNETLVEGEYVYKVEVDYTDSITLPKSNLENAVLDLFIPAGTAEDSKSFKVKYKFWAGKFNNEDVTVDDLEERWLDKDATFEKRIKLDKGEKYFVYAPADCDVIFDATGCGDVYPVQNGGYTHTFENGETQEYKLWYMYNAGTYFNLRVVSVAE